MDAIEQGSSDRLVISDLAMSHAQQKNGDRLEICRAVSFSIRAGEILGLFGPNGCGKSTLLRGVAGLKELDDGQVRLPVLDGDSEAERDSAMALVPQHYRQSFFGWASLRTNIKLAMPRGSGGWRRRSDRIRTVQESLDLDLDLSLRPHVCSGGMLQLAALIRAFALQPRLLLCDEPFSAMDVEVATRARQAFRRVVKEQKIAAVVVLHNLEDIVEVCDHVLVIPNKPFTSVAWDERRNTAVLFENGHVGRRSTTLGGRSFIEVAESVLSRTT
jgi:ABC-type nitrate/sulfonate/bicarbonate transport system ATPase subunit